jgi:hypothetical protein
MRIVKFGGMIANNNNENIMLREQYQNVIDLARTSDWSQTDAQLIQYINQLEALIPNLTVHNEDDAIALQNAIHTRIQALNILLGEQIAIQAEQNAMQQQGIQLMPTLRTRQLSRNPQKLPAPKPNRK